MTWTQKKMLRYTDSHTLRYTDTLRYGEVENGLN
jgi:hypothetical protein